MSFTFKFPSYSIGKDAYTKVDEECKKYGKKAIVIGGHTAISKAKPYFEKEIKDIEIIDYIWYGGEASFENCDMVLENKSVKEADMIFAVGGGKACDCAKEVQIKTDLPLFTFPTIAATCASCTQISITYYQSGESRTTLKMKQPPIHVFINTEIIMNAPSVYLWAGIGDTLGKYYEVSFSARGKELDWQNEMALSIAPLTNSELMMYGAKGYQDAQNKELSNAFTMAVLDCIITTGYVSILVDNSFNTALAHAVYYGFTLLDPCKEKHLHGEIVSYGVLVQVMMDKDYLGIEEVDKVYKFNKSMNLPTKLADLDVNFDTDKFDDAIRKAEANKGLVVTPYKVTFDKIYQAIKDLEEYNKNK